MFHDIPDAMLARMRELEALDAQQRRDGTPTPQRLCAVPPETGRFLALLAAASPPGAMLEVGTSGGYSTMWLTLAARTRAQRVQCFERAAHKTALARETFAAAGIGDRVTLTEGDAHAAVGECHDVAFCFVDHAKELYTDCYELIVPNLVPGGVLAADNILSHQEACAPFVAHVLADPRVDALVVPIGKGVLVARRAAGG